MCLVSKEKTFAIVKYLEDAGHIYTTTSEYVVFPLNFKAPKEITDSIYQLIANTTSEIGTSDSEIAQTLDRK